MKLCMIVKSHLTRFHHISEGFEFSFRFYRLLSTCGHTPFLNDPVIDNQGTKFNFFLIIIDLESPENITTVV